MNKKILTILVFWILVASLSSQTEESVKLFPVFVKGKYGYINSKGEMVIQPQFDRANKFNNGLALVEIESKNMSDIPNHYDYALGKKGYIDKTGKFVIPPNNFDFAEDFSEGLAGVSIKEHKEFNSSYGYIDVIGKIVIKPQFQTVGKFREGTADVRMPNGKWGVIDKEGKFIITPIYDGVVPFSENIGIGGIIKNKKSTPFDQKISDFESVFYDRSGNIIVHSKYFAFGLFNDGLVLIVTEQGEGFIDKTGKIIIEPKFRKALSFSEGLCPVLVDKNWGYIDKTGKMIVEPRFNKASMFSEGIARVETINGVEFIDNKGKTIIQFHDWDISNFEDGLALFWRNNKRGYIDKTGKVVWEIGNN